LTHPRTKSSLTSPQRRLVELLQTINFGQINNLRVRAGDPVLDPSPRIVRKLRLGWDNAPRRESACEDFFLKQAVLDMIATIAGIGDGQVARIEVAHGLPLFVEIECDAAGFTGGGDARG